MPAQGPAITTDVTDPQPDGVGSRHRHQETRTKVEILYAASLSPVKWLYHGFSTRPGGQSTAYSRLQASGELNLGFTASDDRANVVANREHFLEAVTGDPQFPMVTLRQIHSGIVLASKYSATRLGFRLCQSRRHDDQRAGAHAGDSDCGLHSGAGCRPKAPGYSRISRWLARHPEADCGAGRRPDTTRIRK